jgi:hypothetical protein
MHSARSGLTSPTLPTEANGNMNPVSRIHASCSHYRD